MASAQPLTLEACFSTQALPLVAVMGACGAAAWLIDRTVTGKHVTMSNE